MTRRTITIITTYHDHDIYIYICRMEFVLYYIHHHTSIYGSQVLGTSAARAARAVHRLGRGARVEQGVMDMLEMNT